MPPNVLLIQCDDLGPDDLGLDGPHTPHLLRLAEQSFSAADFSVQPVCSPSRAALLTGRHPLRTGVCHVHGGKDFLHPEERTLAGRLRDAGYATGMWGKWHLGHSEGYYPWQRGFDEAYMADLYRHRHTRGRLNGAPIAREAWADEVLVDMAADFIHRHRDRPFFAYLPTLTPHTPHDAPENWVEFHRERGCPPGLAVNRAMISFLDEQIGRLLALLETGGVAENTIVLFLSDHGPAFAGTELNDAERRLRNRSGRRGWKGDLYENGLQSPLFIRWPGHIPPRSCTDAIQLLDLPPTLLELCGVYEFALEGRSFAKELLHPAPFQTGDILTYAHRGWLTSGPPYSLTGIPGEYDPQPPGAFADQSLALRRGDWKLILNPEYASQGELVLHNLREDPAERCNLAAQHPALRDALLNALRQGWEEILREPHAFQPPVLRLRPGENTFPANMPCACDGGARNAVHGVLGWENPNASVTYRLFIAQAGGYRIQAESTPGADWEFSLPPGGQRHSPHEDLHLPAGEALLTLHPRQAPANTRLQRIHIQGPKETPAEVGSGPFLSNGGGS